MKILIGTKNESKIEGARKAFLKFFDDVSVEGIGVSSLVSSEPVNEEILSGARNRINNLKNYARDNNVEADFFVATEGGLSNSFGKWINVNLAAIESLDGTFSMGISPAYQVPDRYIDEIKKCEMGKFYKTIFSEDEYKDVELDSILTNGKYTRESLVESAFIMALTSHIHKDKWTD